MAEAPDALVSLNDHVINELIDALGAETFQELCTTFFDDTPPLIAALRSGIANKDPGALRHAAHQLKSTTATLGAEAMSKVLAQIEHRAKTATADPASLDGIEPIVTRIEAAFPAVKEALRRRK